MNDVPASADPITAIYDVEITRAVQTGFSAPFDSTFTLQFTFDPADPTGPAVSVYGTPVFSPVPLPGLTPPAELPITTSPGITIHHSFAQPDSTYLVTAAAQSELAFARGTINGVDASYDRSFHLFSEFSTVTPPVISPETFPLHLAMPSVGQSNFRFAECFTFAPFTGPDLDIGRPCAGAGTGSRVAFYEGIATLSRVEAPAIPEPATVLLVGSGLALMARRRRTTQSCSRE